MTPDQLVEELEEFAAEKGNHTKGVISAACIIGDVARREGMAFPLDAESFTTGEDGNGQVRGMGGAALRALLEKHGVTIAASSEGGRTSRGTVGFMRRYVALLNKLHNAAYGTPGYSQRKLLDLAESFWVEQMKAKLAEKPFSFTLDPKLGLRAAMRELMDLARTRAASAGGSHVHGTVMQHLVGAKLALLFGDEAPGLGLQHHNSNQKDEGLERAGDFSLGDSAIHVTVSPSKGMIAKCKKNLSAGVRPIIVTTAEGVVRAETLADVEEIADRVDVLDFEQFIATNVYEWSRFKSADRKVQLAALIDAYNEIVASVETDQSLRVEFD